MDGIIIAPRDYIESEGFLNKSNLAIFKIAYTKKGKIKKILEYIDVKTGEIISAETAGVRVIKPDAMLERFNRLDALKESVRLFATFLLLFRNKACGFLVPVSNIVQWYAHLTNKQPQHIRRLVQSLISANILSNEFELESVFMINNPNREHRDAKGDLFKAQVIFETKLLKERNTTLDETS